MNGLLNETVIRVVLMVMVKSPGRTCIAGCQVTDLARRTGLERLLKTIGYLPWLLSKIAQARQSKTQSKYLLHCQTPHWTHNPF